MQSQWPKYLLSLLVLFSTLACQEHYSPKPQGYFRIEVPKKEYRILESDCPYHFAQNKQSQWQPKASCWGDLVYPSLRATLQITYKDLRVNNLDSLLNDAHELAYKHTVRADGIEEQLFINEEEQVYGLLYRFQGDAATSFQFFATDSSRHFMRGALYYYAVPNADSLQPVNAFMAGELRLLMETLAWEN